MKAVKLDGSSARRRKFFGRRRATLPRVRFAATNVIGRFLFPRIAIAVISADIISRRTAAGRFYRSRMRTFARFSYVRISRASAHQLNQFRPTKYPVVFPKFAFHIFSTIFPKFRHTFKNIFEISRGFLPLFLFKLCETDNFVRIRVGELYSRFLRLKFWSETPLGWFDDEWNGNVTLAITSSGFSARK